MCAVHAIGMDPSPGLGRVNGLGKIGLTAGSERDDRQGTLRELTSPSFSPFHPMPARADEHHPPPSSLKRNASGR